MTLIVHHLNESRSQRILWLLEELDLPYEVRHYARDAKTRLGPPELRAVHPLGKSPMLSDGARTIIESGAIVEHVIRTHGRGRLVPVLGSDLYADYMQWLYYAEGSAMLPLMLKMYVARLREAGAPLHPRIESEVANHLSYVDGALAGRDYLLGDDLTGADIQMSFVGEVAGAFGELPKYPNLTAWVARFQARPAYARALEKGGPYSFAGVASR